MRERACCHLYVCMCVRERQRQKQRKKRKSKVRSADSKYGREATRTWLSKGEIEGLRGVGDEGTETG